MRKEQLTARLPLALLGAMASIAAPIALAGLPASANAAATPPESTGTCYGSLAPAATADEPYLLAYRFHCDTRITAYTIVVNRGLNDFDTIDDFDVSPSVLGPDGTTPNATTSWACEGYTPGASLNCSTGGGSTFMPAWSYADGSFDLIGPYCKNLPAGAKTGTRAQPRALVQLVVSDYTGAEDGPFRLDYSRKCPAVPDRVPASKTKRKKHQTNR